MIQNDIVISEFGRHRLDTLDFSVFLQRYGVEQWPNGAALRKQMGSLMITFHGYDEDQRELHCIPEVRRFVQEFYRVWPYWLYFLCPAGDVSSLSLLAACCLTNVSVVQVEGAPLCAVDCEPEEMKAFLTGLLPAFKRVADQAKVFPEIRRQHLIENYAMFGLKPDDAALVAAGAA